MGTWLHLHLGAALARLEAQVGFATLLARWPQVQLAAQTVEWSENADFRGLKRLPITCA